MVELRPLRLLVVFAVCLSMGFTITAYGQAGGSAAEATDNPDNWRMTFDLGLSTGAVNDRNYTEANLGLNLYMKRWFAWRNAVFGRFASGVDTVYGLDTGARGILDIDFGPVGGLTTFAGPGWRFVNEGKNAPFVEAGLVFKLVGINLGGGVKSVMNKAIDKNLENDTQYFIILSGGGSL